MSSTEIILNSILAMSACIIVALVILIVRRARKVVRMPYPGQAYEHETDDHNLIRTP